MKPEAQRIAIAEACGWSFDHINHHAMYYVPSTGAHVGNPLNSLDAMHEALSSMDWGALKLEHYRKHLHDACKTEGQGEWLVWFVEHNAKAAQRAEAFLRTIGKWEDQP